MLQKYQYCTVKLRCGTWFKSSSQSRRTWKGGEDEPCVEEEGDGVTMEP